MRQIVDGDVKEIGQNTAFGRHIPVEVIDVRLRSDPFWSGPQQPAAAERVPLDNLEQTRTLSLGDRGASAQSGRGALDEFLRPLCAAKSEPHKHCRHQFRRAAAIGLHLGPADRGVGVELNELFGLAIRHFGETDPVPRIERPVTQLIERRADRSVGWKAVGRVALDTLADERPLRRFVIRAASRNNDLAHPFADQPVGRLRIWRRKGTPVGLDRRAAG